MKQLIVKFIKTALMNFKWVTQRFEQARQDIEVHLAQEAAVLVRVLFGDESGLLKIHH